MSRKEVVDKIRELVQDNTSPEYDIDKVMGYSVKCIEQEGGEGEGEHYRVVLELTKEDDKFLIMCTGYYNSYDGTDWTYGDVYECEAYDKVITAYREVQ